MHPCRTPCTLQPSSACSSHAISTGGPAHTDRPVTVTTYDQCIQLQHVPFVSLPQLHHALSLVAQWSKGASSSDVSLWLHTHWTYQYVKIDDPNTQLSIGQLRRGDIACVRGVYGRTSHSFEQQQRYCCTVSVTEFHLRPIAVD